MTSKVPVDIYASVGGGEPELFGTVLVAVKSSKSGDSLILDLSGPFRRMKNSVEWYDPNRDEDESHD